MKSKEEIKNWLLENAYDEEKELLDLSDIDFGDISVRFSRVKAYTISNTGQEATMITNDFQKAEYIQNIGQKVNK